MQAKTDDSVIKGIPTILLGFDFICQWQYITSAIACLQLVKNTQYKGRKENKKLIKITISVDKQKSRCYLSICKVLALKNKEC